MPRSKVSFYTQPAQMLVPLYHYVYHLYPSKYFLQQALMTRYDRIETAKLDNLLAVWNTPEFYFQKNG